VEYGLTVIEDVGGVDYADGVYDSIKGLCLTALTQIFASQKLLLCWKSYLTFGLEIMDTIKLMQSRRD